MRQRSKSELLLNMRAYESLKKTKADGTEINERAPYWRMGVEWSYTLWKIENWSANEIAKLLYYVAEHDVTDLSEERREEIRCMLKDKVRWILKNRAVVNAKNVVDIAIQNNQENCTRIMVDYCLLACEYLMSHKGYSAKRLNRVMDNVYALDNQNAVQVCNMRKELFDHKGIWIDLNGDMPGEVSEVIQNGK